jgi:hypothetical protein
MRNSWSIVEYIFHDNKKDKELVCIVYILYLQKKKIGENMSLEFLSISEINKETELLY